MLSERMRGLPNDCCKPDRALCCYEKQKEVPYANSKEILRKGNPRMKTMHSVSFSRLLVMDERHRNLGYIAVQ